MKSIAIFLVFALLGSDMFGQTYDQNKVTAFFQDQQYDEAITHSASASTLITLSQQGTVT